MKDLLDVESFCDNLGSVSQVSKPKKSKVWMYIGAFGISLTLGMVIFYPVFNNRSGLNIVSDFMNPKTVEMVGVGDDIPQPYLYENFIAPDNSFGIGNTTFKTVNWSYFKQLFNSHCDWMLEYKRYSNSVWTNGNEYLTIEKTWNDSLSGWKFNLVLDAPVDIYSARFTFGCDLAVLNYVERDGWQVNLNYTVPGTEEVYNCFFNWSDMASIPGVVFTKGVQGDVFWFRFRRDNIPSGHYEFDPWFGSKGTSGTAKDIGAYTYATEFEANGTGQVTEIAWYMNPNRISRTHKVAIYDVDENLLGQGEKDLGSPSAPMFYTVTLDSPVSITSGTSYYLAGRGSISGCYAYYVSGANYWYDTNTYAQFPEDPATPGGTGSRMFGVYANYTEGGGASHWENNCSLVVGEQPSNGSTGQPLAMAVGATITDAEANHTMNVTFATNESGSWVNMQTNTSISPNGTVNWTYSAANVADTHYFWRVYVHDGFCNNSFTFNYWTDANASVETRWSEIVGVDYNGVFNNNERWSGIGGTAFNGEFVNSDRWSGITGNAFNGEFVNDNRWMGIGGTSFDGIFKNTTSWAEISGISFNGIFVNSTNWYIVNNSFNGEFVSDMRWDNITGTSFNGWFNDSHRYSLIDNSINGIFNSGVGWSNVSTDINGVFSNQSTFWVDISLVDYNGRFTNYTGNATGSFVLHRGFNIGVVAAAGLLCVVGAIVVPLLFFKKRRYYER